MTRGRFIVALGAIALMACAPAFARGLIQPPEVLDKIKPGMTAQEVETILGLPANRSEFPRVGLTSMDYTVIVWGDIYDVGVMIGTDGRVREVQKVRRLRGG